MAAKAFITVLAFFLALSACSAAQVNLTNLFKNANQTAVENNYNLYSEIVNTTAGSNFHFMYVENNLTANANAPIIVILNGGAYIGTSGLLNVFQGFGPVNYNMTTKQWQPNQYSWHLAPSHLLYIESTFGAGFSWQTTPSVMNTTQLGTEVINALLLWVATYKPTQNFTIFGEGQASLLATEVASLLVNNNAYNTTLKPKFQGLLLGNGAFTSEELPTWTNKHQFFYKNNLISEIQFEGLNECLTNPNSVQCAFAQEQAENNLFPGLNQYYIYTSCAYNGSPQINDISEWNDPQMLCIDTTATTALLQNYVNNTIDDVLSVNVSQIAGQNWTAFNGAASQNLNLTNNTLNRSLSLLQGLRNASIVLQFYSGDANIMFSYVDAKSNIPQIPGINQVNYSYFGSNVPYNPNDYIQPCLQVGGFGTYYDQKTTYYWVKHAGFFTANDQPIAMWNVFEFFLQSVNPASSSATVQTEEMTTKLDL